MAADGDLVQFPQRGELLAGLPQALHQPGGGRVRGPPADGRPQVRDVHPAVPLVFLGRVRVPRGRVGDVAFFEKEDEFVRLVSEFTLAP